ncbi:Wzz/FepE/Etk N-terminal domain-containing protein [Rhizobium sp. Root1220]|uniref:Wzz/FepE/Etk N-terminal domain-containing protein n=1 Tax=Rhizobium sp. Root1220 TaxID=1736432 RepID=UPI0006F65C64|nr:Wzz/FepE/Etk N-terminal domain-containing protein [Rhizobium sp. Root1220]KQV83781.1 hypothetical protein ASC90_19145 [Rhizobium sp. Root1220]
MNDVADLRMLLGLVRRQMRTILATGLAIFLLSVAVVFLLTPRFSAQALVLVDTSSKNLLAPDAVTATGLTDNSRVEGEVRIAQSDAVLLDVVQESELLSDPEFGPHRLTDKLLALIGSQSNSVNAEDLAKGKVLASLKDAVRVRREGLTYLITVGVTSDDPQKAAKLANQVAAVYIRKQVDAKVASTISARNILQHKVESARDVLAEHQKELDLFVATHGDPHATSGNAASFSERHLADAGFGKTVTDVISAGEQVGAPSGLPTQFYSLQQSAQIARTQYQNLLTRLQDFEAQASLQVADSRVVSEALTPIVPSYPKKVLSLAVMAIVALGFGVGAAVMKEFFIGGFTSEDQVGAVLNIPLASVSPHQEGSELDRPQGRGLSDTIMAAPLSVFSESIRRIRAAIDQILLGKSGVFDHETDEGIVVMVCSTLPGEGKSTLAVSLARTYALAGKRTLLIDCDLRKPSIHRHVDREPTPAFVNLLRGEPDPGLASMVVMDSATNLSVILGARPADFPTDDLLMSPKVKKLLARAREHFDYIVIDTPPVEAAVDALYLARLSDAVLFVVRWANTPQNAARRAVTALKGNAREGVPVVAALNMQDQRGWFGTGLKT